MKHENFTKKLFKSFYYLSTKIKLSSALSVFLFLSVINDYNSQTIYTFTGGQQTFTAPTTGCYRIEAWGAKGGNDATNLGGNGGYAQGEVNLQAGQVIYIYVGGLGANGASGTGGGWNGGGNAGSSGSSGGGGGASDVRIGGINLIHRVIVAGGGGGAGNTSPTNGGAGGGTSGINANGNGGTQTTGGAGGNAGSLGQGGHRASGTDGGGGGGGYYGGGAANGDHGGGGGSSYIGGIRNGSTIAGNASMPNPTGGANVTGNTGDGMVKIISLPASNPTITGNTTICIGKTTTLSSGEAAITSLPTGGTSITITGSERMHVFASGTSNFSTTYPVMNAKILIVGGGGGGNSNGSSGGGGAGGLVLLQNQSIPIGNTAVSIGIGGIGGTGGGSLGIQATNGGNSSFGSSIAYGGGYGSPGGHRTVNGSAGGSGGGAASYNFNNYSGGTGISGQGYRGGNATTTAATGWAGAGGGGAGGQGIDVSTNNTTSGGGGSNGGPGLNMSVFFGTSVGDAGWFAGGGAGGGTTGSVGGQGGGGSHENPPIPNTGGGGSGAGIAGATGVVIVRYNLPWASNNPSVATVDPITGIVTGISVGTANITYTSFNGCQQTTTITVRATSNPPTNISGGGNYCHGNNLTLTQSGGTNELNAVDVWYENSCNLAVEETWVEPPTGRPGWYVINTTVNSANGILNLTNTGNGDAIIGIGGLNIDPNVYRYVQIRYRYISGPNSNGGMQVFFENGSGLNESRSQRGNMTLDGNWRILELDMATNYSGVASGWTGGPNITLLRFDWSEVVGIVMEFDFFLVSQGRMIGQGTSLSINSGSPYYPTGTTTYYARKIDDCGATPCISATVTLPNKINTLATSTEAATCIINANETVHFYNTTSGRYIATVSANATALGSTTATTFINTPSPVAGQVINTHECGNPTLVTAVLGRHWTINPATNTSATVRLPYYNQELAWLYPASGLSSSPHDDLSTQAELGLSKYSRYSSGTTPHSSVNNLWTDNCPVGNTTWQGANGYGDLSSYTPLTWPANGDKFSMFNITGFSEFWLHASNTIVTPLAVVLSDFSASCNNKTLTWTTVSEQNSSHFVVEQSRNGYEWSVIATVEGAGTTNAVNNYLVNNNLSANYYRLKQVDFDGKTEYLGPIHVDCENAENALTVYPNPNSGMFTVSINSTEELGESIIFVHDVSGKVVDVRDINILSGTNTVQFENNNLMSGTYIVSVKGKNNNTLTPVKLVVQ